MLPDAHTRIVALLGYPLGHTLSPLIHNTAFQAQGFNGVYLALRVAPADVHTALQALRVLPFLGANVTIPHKQAVYALMDACSPQAEAVGAVNTVVCRRDEATGTVTLYGDNTDVAGFLAPLDPYAQRLQGASMVVLGAGGAARAVVYALLQSYAPSRLAIVARTPSRGVQLAADLRAYDTADVVEVLSPAEAGQAIRDSTLVVNATPVGTSPHINQTPWSVPSDFAAHHIIYDLVYNPVHTRLLTEASAAGAVGLGGMDMLIAQAAASYVQWTGQALPVAAVRAALQR